MNQNRKITSLGKTNQRKLREFWLAELNLSPSARISTLMKVMGAETADECYQIMRESYNDAVSIIKQDIKRETKLLKTEKRASLKTIVKKLNSLSVVALYRAKQAKKIASVISIPNGDDIISKIRAALKPFVHKSVVVEFIVEKRVIQSDNFEIPSAFSSWWKDASKCWWASSSETIFDLTSGGNVFIYPQHEGITSALVMQHFREGITNCMLTPIRKWAQEKYDEATTKPTKSRYHVVLERLTEFEMTFKDGVPEDMVHELCNRLQIDISIEMPFCEKSYLECKSLKKSLRSFRFLNSRFDHAEYCESGQQRFNKITSLDKAEDVSREQLDEMVSILDENNEFYTYKKKNGKITCISTLHGQFKIADPFSVAVQEFEIETGLNFCKIDDVDDKELSAFVKEASNYNETVDFREFVIPKFSEIEIPVHPYHAITDLKHADMARAYAMFQECKWYAGFLGKITDFRPTDSVQGVGIYRITKLNFSKCDPAFAAYNSKMKMYLDNNPYCSPELDMLTSFGVEFKIVSGCWGVDALDFEFNDTMLNTRLPSQGEKEGPRYYCKYAGVCDSHFMEKKQWLKCDESLFNVIAANTDADVKRRYDNGEASFSYYKKHNYHLGHVNAFITAYQRMSVIEQLMEIKIQNVVRICTDGIYYDGPEVEMKNVFRQKPDRNFSNLASNSFVSVACKKALKNKDGSPREDGVQRLSFAKELHLGEGGCGKTHFNLNDHGLVRPLFVAPSWKLARSKERETGIKCTVWARVLTDDPERISSVKERANVLIIDEVSMLTEHQKQQFFEEYSNMKIIMCGDLGYQLPCITGEPMNAEGFDNVVQHKGDRRCNDPDLRAIKAELREMIHYDRPLKEINAWVMKEFARLGRTITVDQLKGSYDVEDMVLTGTNVNKDYFTGLFTGKFSKEKYYITENTRLHQNGEIVIGDKPETKSEIRHSFTVHSIQGETAENDLFIDCSTMFDARMFYTAISRARSLGQIFILSNAEEVMHQLKGKIYKIESKSGVYIGSTIKSIDQRFKEHMDDFKAFQKKKAGKVCTSVKLMGDDDVRIELVCDFPCNSKYDLWAEEKRIIQSVDCVNKTYK